jgi:energy-coupling factor transport system permease protein
MIAVVSLFTSITSEEEIVRGVEEGLRPLARLGLPVHLLSLAVGAAVRFVPIVAEELEAIAKAQSCRGADFGSGRKGPIARARAWLPLFVPVVVRALERAELLAEAMEARCYTGKGRAPTPPQPASPGERVVRALTVLGSVAWLATDVLILNVRIRPW